MNTILTVSLVQMAVTRGQPEENLQRAAPLIADAARRGSQIVCMPEMWTTGFPWDEIDGLADAHEHNYIPRIAALANENKVWLIGSVPAKDEAGQATNTAFLFAPDGTVAGYYRKVHLFSLMGENKNLGAGDAPGVFSTPWGRTGVGICYDLRFPELFRSCALAGATLQFLPAAWPHPRLEHWRTLIRARAIENQLFFCACNQCGQEDFGGGSVATYFGHSMIVDPWGKVIAEAGEGEEVITGVIDFAELERVRAKIPVFKDRRPDVYPNN